MRAFALGRTEIAEELLAAGAKTDMRDNLGRACQDYAMLGGHLNMIKYLGLKTDQLLENDDLSD